MSSPASFADLSPAQSAAVERCAALARSRGIVVWSEGHVIAGEFAGAPCWAVSSSRSTAALPSAHIVCSVGGRLLCSCPARRSSRVFTCSHAQAVRLLLLARAGAVQPASVPYVESSAPASPPEEPAPADPEMPATCGPFPLCLRPSEEAPAVSGGPVVPICSACNRTDVRACAVGNCPYRQSIGLPLPAPAEPAPAVAPIAAPADPDPDPEPDPDPAPSGPRCPSCGGEAEQRELDELGECLRCVAGSAERRGEYVARCACGAVATGETKDGPVCDQCATRRQERIGQLIADAKKTATAGAINLRMVERERSRQKRYQQIGREAAGDPRPQQAKEERKAKATATRAKTEDKKPRPEPKPHEVAPPAARLDNSPVTIWK